MKLVVMSLLVATPFCLSAQTWKLNLETGATLSRLLPTNGSSMKGGTLRYGYSRPGIYIAPEVQLKVNEHLDASFNYQYTNAIVGPQHKSYNAHISNYNGVDMHGFNLGIHAHRPVFHGHLKAGVIARAGLSYNKVTMIGAGGGGGGDMSGSIYNAPSYSYTGGPADFSIMRGAWTPTATIGFSLGTNSKKWIADRLSLNWAASMGLRNTYNAPSSYNYAISTPNGTEAGTVRYQGIPFVMQLGVKYRIAGFGGKN